ncbi:MAG TPA: hypothetical protein VE991_04505 [Acidimicrobiales bacterium]|nr:hypothetical protein [Acidimicrobiales bacterium]
MEPDDVVSVPDLLEQEQPVDEEPLDEEPVHVDSDVPVADAIEQATVVQADQIAERPDVRDDVPIADAIEQSIEVRTEEDY